MYECGWQEMLVAILGDKPITILSVLLNPDPSSGESTNGQFVGGRRGRHGDSP